MALPASTIWEVRTTGSDTLCSGGFVFGASGTDYSQQAAAQYNAADLVAPTTTTITSASHSFVAADVGNILRVTAGTGWTVGFYQIVSVATGTATVDRAIATAASTGGTYYVGGCFASPGQAGAAHVAGNQCYIKLGTYTITSATANVSGGCVSWTTQAAGANAGKIYGYNTTRGDRPTGASRPTMVASGIATFTLVIVGSGNHGENIIVDGASLTSSRGMNAGASTIANCKGQNCTNSAFSSGFIFSCEATGCSSSQAIANVNYAFGCWAHDNTAGGFAYSICLFCIASNNTGKGFDDAFTGLLTCWGCTAYGNSSDGFKWNTGAGAAANAVINCLSYGNGGYGFNISSAQDMYWLYNCAAGSNTAGATNNFTAANLVGMQTLTADPFTNKASNDYSLNSTAGGGAACRAVGFPGVFPGGLTTGYADIGAVQHQDAGGGAPSITSLILQSIGTY